MAFFGCGRFAGRQRFHAGLEQIERGLSLVVSDAQRAFLRIAHGRLQRLKRFLSAGLVRQFDLQQQRAREDARRGGQISGVRGGQFEARQRLARRTALASKFAQPDQGVVAPRSQKIIARGLLHLALIKLLLAFQIKRSRGRIVDHAIDRQRGRRQRGQFGGDAFAR